MTTLRRLTTVTDAHLQALTALLIVFTMRNSRSKGGQGR